MQVLASVLCVLLLASWILVVLGLREDSISDEKVLDNQLEDDNNESEPQIQYDEYPMVVPKRAALLLDRIMVALQKALEDDETPSVASVSTRGGGKPSKSIQPQLLPLPRISPRDDNNMDGAQYLRMDPTNVGLQRRGHTNANNNSNPKGRVWRCYFNAVTCFKKRSTIN